MTGPAFVFQIIEVLADGGVHEGLPRDTCARGAGAAACMMNAVIAATRRSRELGE